jgi:hypothetical protein
MGVHYYYNSGKRFSAAMDFRNAYSRSQQWMHIKHTASTLISSARFSPARQDNTHARARAHTHTHTYIYIYHTVGPYHGDGKNLLRIT